MTFTPEVTQRGFLSMQVCVPADWTDDQVKAFADTENPAGTENGWFVRKQGDAALAGCDERVKCGCREGAVHIILDC